MYHDMQLQIENRTITGTRALPQCHHQSNAMTNLHQPILVSRQTVNQTDSASISRNLSLSNFVLVSIRVQLKKYFIASLKSSLAFSHNHVEEEDRVEEFRW